jgi:hypothetical protein
MNLRVLNVAIYTFSRSLLNSSSKTLLCAVNYHHEHKTDFEALSAVNRKINRFPTGYANPLMYVHTDVIHSPFEQSLVTSVPTPIPKNSSCSKLNILDQFCVIFTIKLHRKYREEGLNVPSASLSNVNTLLQPLKLLYATRYRPPTLPLSQL